MGYSTYFTGEFNFNNPLDENLRKYLTFFSESRRMKRDVAGFGVDGEFFIPLNSNGGVDNCGQNRDTNIVDFNRPPSTQPGLWCQWIPSEDGMALVWDEGEKFYNYVEWLAYLIDRIIAPAGYVLNGEVEWEGEESTDAGIIRVDNNVISVAEYVRQLG